MPVSSEQGTDVVEQPALNNTPSTGLQNPAMALAAIEHAALVFIAEHVGPTGLTVSSSARFYNTVTPLENDPVLKPMAMLDTCEIGSEASQINADALDLPIDHLLEAGGNEILQVTSVSAGDTVELSAASGSFASLDKNLEQDTVQYNFQDGTDLTVAVPALLDVDVSGDVFPQLAFSWNTPERVAAEIRDEVRSGATLTWTAASNLSNSVQSRLLIYAGFINELTGEMQSYQCELADDGEFSLPADVQALYAGGLSANFVDVARYTRSAQLVNGISVTNVFLQRF